MAIKHTNYPIWSILESFFFRACHSKSDDTTKSYLMAKTWHNSNHCKSNGHVLLYSQCDSFDMLQRETAMNKHYNEYAIWIWSFLLFLTAQVFTSLISLKSLKSLKSHKYWNMGKKPIRYHLFEMIHSLIKESINIYFFWKRIDSYFCSGIKWIIERYISKREIILRRNEEKKRQQQ